MLEILGQIDRHREARTLVRLVPEAGVHGGEGRRALPFDLVQALDDRRADPAAGFRAVAASQRKLKNCLQVARRSRAFLPKPNRADPIMKTSLRRTLATAAVLAAIASPTETRAQFPQPETLVPWVNGTQSLQYGQQLTAPALGTFPELPKTITFDGVDRDQVRLHVLGSAVASFTLRVQVFDPTGELFDDRTCSATASGGFIPTASCELRMILRLVGTGRWSVRLSVTGGAAGMSALVGLERVPPTYVPPDLPFGTTIRDKLWPITDTDFLKFEAQAGSFLQLVLDLEAGLGPDTRIEVRDPRRQTISIFDTPPSNGFPAGGTFSIPLGSPTSPLTMTGTYLVMVSVPPGGSTGFSGEYDLTLHCLAAASGQICEGLLHLTADQPDGAGSLRLENRFGNPNDIYITVFSARPENETLPGLGDFGGLHIPDATLGAQLAAGVPFIGLLDSNGESHWQIPTGIPPGLPKFYWISRTLDPTTLAFTKTSGIIPLIWQ